MKSAPDGSGGKPAKPELKAGESAAPATWKKHSMSGMDFKKDLRMQESEQEARNDAKSDAKSEARNDVKKPEANDLQKLMKERFGEAKFGTLMNSIVDEMFKNMAGVGPTYGGTEGVEGSGGNKQEKADKAGKEVKAVKLKKADQADPIGE